METNNKNNQDEKEPAIKPDEETLESTDPQEEMEGPVSSLLQRGKESIDHSGNKKGHIEHENEKDQEKEQENK